MADDENESRSGDEKPEVKENAELTNKNENEKKSEKDTVVTEASDSSKKEEKSPKKTEKNIKEDKNLKKEKPSKKEDTDDDEKINRKAENSQKNDKPKKEKPSKKEDTDDDEKINRKAENSQKNDKPKKEKPSKKEDTEEDENDDDEEELPPGLLERPLEVEGKREKKKVERLSASMISSPPEKKKVEIEQGSGKKLGDIPYVENQLNSTKAVDLKPLHRVLFLRLGAVNEIKKNIRQFSGFTYEKDSKEYEKRLACLNKMVLAELKVMCLVLGLERSGTKPQLVERVMEFLEKPKDKGLNIKAKTKKKSKSPGSKKQATKRKISKETKKGKTKKGDDSSPEEDSDEDQEEEEEEEKEEEESEDEVPKKKKAKTESKKKPPKKSLKENGKNEKAAPKKETKKPAAKKKPVPESSDDSLSEDSEDEPIAKIKKSPPSNSEIKDLVKKILDGADFETVTMKTVVKQVYAKYPLFDLSDRKDFIKDTVREVIS